MSIFTLGRFAAAALVATAIALPSSALADVAPTVSCYKATGTIDVFNGSTDTSADSYFRVWYRSSAGGSYRLLTGWQRLNYPSGTYLSDSTPVARVSVLQAAGAYQLYTEYYLRTSFGTLTPTAWTAIDNKQKLGYSWTDASATRGWWCYT